jgi:hypothetical protein
MAHVIQNNLVPTLIINNLNKKEVHEILEHKPINHKLEHKLIINIMNKFVIKTMTQKGGSSNNKPNKPNKNPQTQKKSRIHSPRSSNVNVLQIEPSGGINLSGSTRPFGGFNFSGSNKPFGGFNFSGSTLPFGGFNFSGSINGPTRQHTPHRTPIFLSFDERLQHFNRGAHKKVFKTIKVGPTENYVRLTNNNVDLNGINVLLLTEPLTDEDGVSNKEHMIIESKINKILLTYGEDLVPIVSGVYTHKGVLCFFAKECIPLDYKSIDAYSYQAAINARLELMASHNFCQCDMKPANMCLNGDFISFLDMDPQTFYPTPPEFQKTIFDYMKLLFWEIYNKQTKPDLRLEISLFDNEGHFHKFCQDLVDMNQECLTHYIDNILGHEDPQTKKYKRMIDAIPINKRMIRAILTEESRISGVPIDENMIRAIPIHTPLFMLFHYLKIDIKTKPADTDMVEWVKGKIKESLLHGVTI